MLKPTFVTPIGLIESTWCVMQARPLAGIKDEDAKCLFFPHSIKRPLKGIDPKVKCNEKNYNRGM